MKIVKGPSIDEYIEAAIQQVEDGFSKYFNAGESKLTPLGKKALTLFLNESFEMGIHECKWQLYRKAQNRYNKAYRKTASYKECYERKKLRRWKEKL